MRTLAAAPAAALPDATVGAPSGAAPPPSPLGAAAAGLLEDVAGRVAEALEVWECDLYEYLPERDELVAVAVWSRELTEADRRWVGSVVVLGQRPTYARVVREQVVIENQRDDPAVSEATRQLMDAWGERSTLHVPLVQRGKVAGVMTVVEGRWKRRFSPEDRRLLDLLAVPAAAAVTNGRLLREQEQRTRELGSLLESIRAMNSAATVEDVLETVAAQCAAALDVPACSIFEYDAALEAIVLRAEGAAQPDPCNPVGTVYSLQDFPDDRRVLATGTIVEQRVADETLDTATRESMRRFGELSCLSVPLWFQGEPVGLLEIIETRWDRHFTPEERRLAQGLGEQAGAAINTARLFRRQEQQNRRLTLLLETSRAIASSGSVEAALQTVSRKATETLGCGACEISSYEEAEAALVLRAIHGPRQVLEQPFNAIGSSYGLDAHEADCRVLLVIDPVEQHASDPSLDEVTRAELETWGVTSCLSVPLALKDRAIGILRLMEFDCERHFSEEEVELACGLAEQAAVALESARRYGELQELTDELENQLQVRHSLLELSEDLLSLRDQEAVFEKIAAVLRHIVAYESLEISLIDEGAGELVEVFLGEGSLNETLGFRMPLGPGVCGAVIEHGRAEMIDDMLRDPRAVQVPDTDMEEQASIVAPLQAAGKVIGVLSVSRFGGRRFEEREFELVKLITNLSAIAIWNARMFEEMQEQAIHDGLTGLYNHRHFYERLGQEVARSQRYGTELSLLMIDLDDFKKFNDTHGHLAGDEVLQTVARILQAHVRRDVDIVARYGGEEFAVLLPNTARS
jgi:GAF domain-containing protein